MIQLNRRHNVSSPRHYDAITKGEKKNNMEDVLWKQEHQETRLRNWYHLCL